MRLSARICRAASLLMLVLAAGCVSRVPLPPIFVPATAVTPAQQRVIETAAPATAGTLAARHTEAAPIIDGHAEAVWAGAEPLPMPLTWGIRGTERARDVELRALYTSDAIFFLARWPDASPSDPMDATANKLTVHWHVDTPAGSPAPACNVACHTAYVDGRRLVYVHAETIPSGSDEALPAAGGWQDGMWTLEWSRPLVNDNPYELQFADLGRGYQFFVKVFERIAGRPDAVSAPYLLMFQPSAPTASR